jgi:hypothetical protein
MAAAEGRESVRELQISGLFCKPICKPDAARRTETGETQKIPEDFAAPLAEVNAVTRDGLRQQRHTSYGS